MINQNELHTDRRMRLIHNKNLNQSLFDSSSPTCQTEDGNKLEVEMSNFTRGLYEKWINKGYSTEEIFTIISGPLYFWAGVFDRGEKEKNIKFSL